MNKKRTFLYTFFVNMVLTLICATTAYSQSSANYTINRDVLDEGGGTSSSANHSLASSISQTSAIGHSSSGNYANYAGFISEGGTPDKLRNTYSRS